MTQPRRKRGALSEEERAVWDSFVQGLTPLPGRRLPPPPAPPPAGTAPPPSPPAPAPKPMRGPPTRLAVGEAPGGLDRGTWKRLRSGRMEVERVLDLHGRTAERAHRDLRHFLLNAHADGTRCVEVITGRGAGEGGILRRELPEWLNHPDLRGLVLAVVHPHARNLGAVRVLLRRR